MESSSLCSNLSETLRHRVLFEGLVSTVNSSPDHTLLCKSCCSEFQAYVETAYRCEQANVRAYLSAQGRIGKEGDGSSSSSEHVLNSLIEAREAEKDLAGATESVAEDLRRLRQSLVQITDESRRLQRQIDAEMHTMLSHEHDIALLQSDLSDMLTLEDSASREMAYLGGILQQRCRIDPLMCLEETEEGAMTVNRCRLMFSPAPGARGESSRAWALLALCAVLLRNRCISAAGGQAQQRECVYTRVEDNSFYCISLRPLSDRCLIAIKQSTRSGDFDDKTFDRTHAISFECPAEVGGECAAAYKRAIFALAAFVAATLEEAGLQSCLQGQLEQVRSDLAAGCRVGFEAGSEECCGKGSDLSDLTRDIFRTVQRACGQARTSGLAE